MSWIEKVLSWFVTAPPLEAYNIPKRGERKKAAPVEKPLADEQGFVGGWKDSQHYEAVNANLKTETHGLDEYDMQALSEKLGDTWSNPKTQAKAQYIKRCWEKGMSSDAISIAKNRARGWSSRTIDDYVSALYAAKEERESAKKRKK